MIGPVERNLVDLPRREIPDFPPPNRQATGSSFCVPSDASTVVEAPPSPLMGKLPDEDDNEIHRPDRGVITLLRQPPTITFCSKKTKNRPKRKLYLHTRMKLRNSLLAAIGFIELANAGDFAANLWNENPLPAYAIFLMVFGGLLAFCMLYFVIKDAKLSWENICGLLEERKFLLKWQKRNESPGSKGAGGVPLEVARTIDCFIAVNFRELGTELVDRFLMGTIMGIGAILVGTGTFMAIAGENEALFLTSNLLTGVIGNSPCALYGLLNLLWAVFVWLRAGSHTSATRRLNDPDTDKTMRARARDVKIHSISSGFTGILAGAASVATFDVWFAYLLLFPCLISSVLINMFFRRRVGYDRPFVRREFCVDEDCLLVSLGFARAHRKAFMGRAVESPTLIAAVSSISNAFAFIRDNNLVEDYCLRLLRDLPEPNHAKVFPEGDTVEVDLDALEADPDPVLREDLRSIAVGLVLETAADCFKYQERWLLEALGCYMAISERDGRGGKQASPSSYRIETQTFVDPQGDKSTADGLEKMWVVEHGEEYGDELNSADGKH